MDRYEGIVERAAGDVGEEVVNLGDGPAAIVPIRRPERPTFTWRSPGRIAGSIAIPGASRSIRARSDQNVPAAPAVRPWPSSVGPARGTMVVPDGAGRASREPWELSW